MRVGKRLAVIGIALPALAAACGWPGSDQVAVAVRCVTRPVSPPPVTAPLPAVWRTHSMPGAGFSIALPDNWDGAALGTPNQDARLAAAAARSPALGDSLRTLAADGSNVPGLPAYLAISTDGDRLDVGLAVGARFAISCAGAPFVDALSTPFDPGSIRQTHFPAGDTRLLTYQDIAVIDGQHEPFTNWLFSLGAPGGRDLLLLFSVHLADMQAQWPIVWAVMSSLRLAPAATAGGVDPQPACLFPDLAARELHGAHRAPCTVPLGARLAEADCGPALADPSRAMDAMTVARGGGGERSPAGGRQLHTDHCLFAAPESGAVWLGAGQIGADLVAYVDFRFNADTQFASIDMRQAGGQALSATATPAGLFLTEYGVGGAAATSLSETMLLPSSGVHRLVLSAVGPMLHAWLDGVETAASVRTRVTQSGAAGIYLTTEDAGPGLFTVLRAAVYAAG